MPYTPPPSLPGATSRRQSPRDRTGSSTSPTGARAGSPSATSSSKTLKMKPNQQGKGKKDDTLSPKLSKNGTKSESSTLKRPSNLVMDKISPNLRGDDSIRESPQSPMSPYYKSFPPFVPPEVNLIKTESDLIDTVDIETPPEIESDKLRANKTNCPCLRNSLGKEWKFKCTRCNQQWHASCANLKGANDIEEETPQQAALDTILQSWLCPWCFTTNFPKPGTSTAAKMDQTLLDSVHYSRNIQVISDAISSAVNQSMPTLEISSLEVRLKRLSEEISDFQRSQEPGIHITSDPKPVSIPLPKTIEPPIKDYKMDFLDEETLESVTSFLSDCKTSQKFVQKNGRMVLKFGESYMYSGDSSPPSSSEIPQPLITAIDKVTSHCKLTHKPNSVLINYYPPPDDVTLCNGLAFHSDDEPDILADSEIATISIGDVRKVSFRPIHSVVDTSDHPSCLNPASNSLYIMTRSSQAWYQHSIGSVPPSSQLPVQTGRYSITLRTISKQFKRSTVIIGDSNTKNIKFGSGTGTMGQSFPGMRAKASKISNIDPSLCIGYSNAVIVCGTNDLRTENLKSPNDVHQLVDILHLKLQQIQTICPRIKIFVTAVLPSRFPRMNKNIIMFNRLVYDMLESSLEQSVWQIGVYHFVDNKGLLAMNLTRNGDEIHLGNRGLSKFVSCVKHWVYVREKLERTRQRKPGQTVGHDPT